MLDSGSPQSSDPDLTRTLLSAQMTNSDQSTPSRKLAFLAATTSPSNTETTPISAIGQNGWPDEAVESGGRAKRELSVIEEREMSLAPQEEGLAHQGREETDEQPSVDSGDLSSPKESQK